MKVKLEYMKSIDSSTSLYIAICDTDGNVKDYRQVPLAYGLEYMLTKGIEADFKYTLTEWKDK